MVRIGMACRTAGKFQATVFCRMLWSFGNVALRTCKLRMQSGKRKPGLVVIEMAYIFPAGCVMARLAIPSELPMMKIFVTRKARTRESKEGPIQIFLPD